MNDTVTAPGLTYGFDALEADPIGSDISIITVTILLVWAGTVAFTVFSDLVASPLVGRLFGRIKLS